jgi:hypothetical protein
MAGTLEDLLPEGVEVHKLRILVKTVYDLTIESDTRIARSRTIGNTKSLIEFYDLVNRAMTDYQARAGTTLINYVNFTEEDPSPKDTTEVISFSVVKREPGAYSQGAPFEGAVKNLRPITRESGKDPNNSDYRFAIQGYWYDNLIRFNCWARTNKQANERACWFEDFMEDYTWWFKLQGVNRVIFWGRGEDQVVDDDGNKWFGRPLDYFVRTEKLRRFEEKKLEEILINLDAK